MVPMGVVEEEEEEGMLLLLPAIGSIRTATIRVGSPPNGEGEEEEEPPSPTTTAASAAKEVEVCMTPKSQRHLLRPTLVCPPAPMKPRAAKRKLDFPTYNFFAAPRDLSSTFLAISGPPEKKIRVG